MTIAVHWVGDHCQLPPAAPRVKAPLSMAMVAASMQVRAGQVGCHFIGSEGEQKPQSAEKGCQREAVLRVQVALGVSKQVAKAGRNHHCRQLSTSASLVPQAY